MSHYLLTGAGFSRNWGGWLGSEVFEYLLGCPETTPELRTLLWQDKQERRGFEDTLGRVQAGARLGDPAMQNVLQGFQQAILRMFSEMNDGLRRAAFEPTNDLELSIGRFLTRFDVLFTLNQDWLLEHHYLNDNVMLLSQGRWNGFVLPGVPYTRPDATSGTRPDLVVPSGSQVALPNDRMQPYYKLHGSSHWRWADGRDLLVMGGEKSRSIDGHRLLAEYFDAFRACLCSPNAKLMVIGYSFNDEHVNKVILDSVRSAGLRVFIVDPLGVDVLDKRDPRAQIQDRPYLMEAMMPRLIGASRRSILSTFGGDRAELARLNRFFD